MGPEAWKRMIGVEAWNHVIRAAGVAEGDGDVVAAVLSAATEIGFRGPIQPPKAVTGTTVLWPDGVNTTTAAGIAAYYHARGHGFFLLRAPELMEAVAGPLALRLQEVLAAYEEQCRIAGKPALPDAADFRVFVGGERELMSDRFTVQAEVLAACLHDESPEPIPGPRAAVSGPERKPTKAEKAHDRVPGKPGKK